CMDRCRKSKKARRHRLSHECFDELTRGFQGSRRQKTEVWLSHQVPTPTANVPTELNAPGTLISCQVVCFALRVVELHPLGFHIDVVVSLLPKIYFRSRDLDFRRG